MAELVSWLVFSPPELPQRCSSHILRCTFRKMLRDLQHTLLRKKLGSALRYPVIKQPNLAVNKFQGSWEVGIGESVYRTTWDYIWTDTYHSCWPRRCWAAPHSYWWSHCHQLGDPRERSGDLGWCSEAWAAEHTKSIALPLMHLAPQGSSACMCTARRRETALDGRGKKQKRRPWVKQPKHAVSSVEAKSFSDLLLPQLHSFSDKILSWLRWESTINNSTGSFQKLKRDLVLKAAFWLVFV